MSDAFDFGKEVERMTASPPIGKDSSIIIWGGAFDEKEFKQFISAWSLDDQPNIVQEHAHKIDFQKTDTNDIKNHPPALLERIEIFDKSGNLSLRRNGNEFLWHFIGNNDATRPETLRKLETAKFKIRNFWEEDPTCKLYQRDESALLWGEYDTNSNRWHDDRVGWAMLDYPVIQALKQSKNRVQIDYTVFTYNGQTAFVWWKELKEAKQ